MAERKTAAVGRRGRGLYPKEPKELQNPGGKGNTLPDYLDADEIRVLLTVCQNRDARLLMLLQWRAGLRISEALDLTAADCRLDPDSPTIRVRKGKGNRTRVVPVHRELLEALSVVLTYGKGGDNRIVQATRQTAYRWIRAAANRAEDLGLIEKGRRIGTHTLRHSYARHLLMHGVPINYLSRWLGHRSLNSTLVYLELVPDPAGQLAQVP